jgi:hypothetical protein
MTHECGRVYKSNVVMYLATLRQKDVWWSGGIAVCILIHVLAGVSVQLHEKISVTSEIEKHYSQGRNLTDPGANMDAAKEKAFYRLEECLHLIATGRLSPARSLRVRLRK